MTATSAPRSSVVSAVAVLSEASGSGVAADTVATLTMGEGPAYPTGTRNVAVIVRVAPAGTVPNAQGNAVVQSPVFDTNARPSGKRSSTRTLLASDSPAFATVIV